MHICCTCLHNTHIVNNGVALDAADGVDLVAIVDCLVAELGLHVGQLESGLQ